MSLSHSQPNCLQFDQVLAPFLTDDGLPFAQILPAAEVEQAFAEAGVDFGTSSRTVYTPAITMWAMLSQVVNSSKSCSAAVLRVATLLVALGRNPCSKDTGAYCRARAKVPALVVRRLALQVGRRLEDAAPATWLWQGRHVRLADGAVITLPDTPENQKAFPQPSSQKPGLGFPMIRMVLLLSLATAAMTNMAYGPYQGKDKGEPALLRQLLGDVPAGTVLLADRYYCSYWMLALALARDLDVVFRLHQKRHYDFRKGQRLGPDDHIVAWHKPPRPDWMNEETYAALPETLQVREVRYTVATAGARTKNIVIATTLLDAEKYTADMLTDLYHQRWHVELDIRAIKQSLHMEHLSCKSPFMIETEIWMHMLGYNLVRKVAAQAAQERGVPPRAVSFTAAKDVVTAAWSQWTLAPPTERVRQGKELLQILGTARVGNRPDRYEPRKVKRRPKPHGLLTEPRAQAKAKLLAGKKTGKKTGNKG